jgi:SAM-dependent methyltransferase
MIVMQNLVEGERLLKVDKCPVCQASRDFSRCFCSVPVGLDGNALVLRCTNCRSLYKAEILPPNALMEQYQSDEYYSFSVGNQLTAGVRSRIRRVSQIRQPCKILDVGCGNGVMVQSYLDTGWDAYGVDPFLRLPVSPNSGLSGRLFKKDVATEMLPIQDFDTVTLWYVMEHIASPSAILKGIARHMSSGGKIFILVPWAESLASQYYQANWSEVVLTEHLIFYSRLGLMLLLKQCGFDQFQFRYAGRPFPLGKVDHSLQAQGWHITSHISQQQDPAIVIGGLCSRNSNRGNTLGWYRIILNRLANHGFFSEVARFGINIFRIGDYIEVCGTKS